MPYNLSIPGWMPEYELRVIEDLAQRVRPNGAIVEVGPFCGRSSWCWAQSAHPSVRVMCLDIWDPGQHPFHPPVAGQTDSDAKLFGTAANPEDALGTLENFRRNTADCPNITPLRGASPDSFLDWPQESVDLVFLDGLHHNPGFHRDLWFWWDRLMPGGIYCGDDYARTHPDVIYTLRDMAVHLGLDIAVKGRIWITQKPLDAKDPGRNAGPRLALQI
jgi:predicted O-methyltransferase YrrM